MSEVDQAPPPQPRSGIARRGGARDRSVDRRSDRAAGDAERIDQRHNIGNSPSMVSAPAAPRSFFQQAGARQIVAERRPCQDLPALERAARLMDRNKPVGAASRW